MINSFYYYNDKKSDIITRGLYVENNSKSNCTQRTGLITNDAQTIGTKKVQCQIWWGGVVEMDPRRNQLYQVPYLVRQSLKNLGKAIILF